MNPLLKVVIGVASISIVAWATITAVDVHHAKKLNIAATHGLLNLNTRSEILPKGSLIVEAFAPWCMFCATTARWDDAKDAAWAHHHHMQFVMTDVSPDGGIGIAAKAPTFASIKSTARDGSRIPLPNNKAIAANLRSFINLYHLHVPVDFWSQGAPPKSWNIRSIPTFLYLNRDHDIVSRLVGYQSTAQFQKWANEIFTKENKS